MVRSLWPGERTGRCEEKAAFHILSPGHPVNSAQTLSHALLVVAAVVYSRPYSRTSRQVNEKGFSESFLDCFYGIGGQVDIVNLLPALG